MAQNEKEKVLVKIINEEIRGGVSAADELITTGWLDRPQGAAFRLRYKEILGEDVKNMTSYVTLTDNGGGCITVEREGPFSMKMLFTEGGSHRCFYSTPYGELLLHVQTAKADTEYLPDRLRVFLDFEVSAEGDPIHRSKMTYFIKPRKSNRGGKDGTTK
ncbi:MAG: DUF1934 domain-containing protein [Clostridia bacterium]|nr:DUF1934 domain-containing protein [Clostridia bacterium]